MDWDEYKRLCDQPHVMSRHLLEVTASLADAAGQKALRERLLGACDPLLARSLVRPRDHLGDARTHMFTVDFSCTEVTAVLHLLDARNIRGEAPIEPARLPAVRAAWREYGDWLAG